MRPSARLAARLGRPLVAAEIGVRDGANALDMLIGLELERLYLVDHYEPYKDGDGFLDRQAQDLFYCEAFKRLRPFQSKITWVTRRSQLAYFLFPDHFFDYVYIDGEHSYAAVTQDLGLWYSRVKPDGVFAGHDIDFPAVKRAVTDFAAALGLNYVEMDKDWILGNSAKITA